jgi:hypothetical protein
MVRQRPAASRSLCGRATAEGQNNRKTERPGPSAHAATPTRLLGTTGDRLYSSRWQAKIWLNTYLQGCAYCYFDSILHAPLRAPIVSRTSRE